MKVSEELPKGIQDLPWWVKSTWWIKILKRLGFKRLAIKRAKTSFNRIVDSL